MIHGYHLIWGTYGFWLPNDPRGSCSDFVASWELVRFGKATKSLERRDIDPARWPAWRAAAERALQFPPVTLTDGQTRAIAGGFAEVAAKSRYAIWACSILPQHVHLVVGRHSYKVETIANLLKGAATKRLIRESLHPHAGRVDDRGKLPSLWAENQWKVFLDSETAIEAAIRYVNDNPLKEGRPAQDWPFVTPFAGINRSGWTTYH